MEGNINMARYKVTSLKSIGKPKHRLMRQLSLASQVSRAPLLKAFPARPFDCLVQYWALIIDLVENAPVCLLSSPLTACTVCLSCNWNNNIDINQHCNWPTQPLLENAYQKNGKETKEGKCSDTTKINLQLQCTVSEAGKCGPTCRDSCYKTAQFVATEYKREKLHNQERFS